MCINYGTSHMHKCAQLKKTQKIDVLFNAQIQMLFTLKRKHSPNIFVQANS